MKEGAMKEGAMKERAMKGGEREAQRHSRYVERGRLQPQEVAHMAQIAATLGSDLHDPAAVEALLVMREVFFGLDLGPAELEAIFGRRLLQHLETWGGVVVPHERPREVQRLWVWAPNWPHPRLHPLDRDGAVWPGLM